MNAAPGIVTSGTGPPNATVVVQPGMNVQPVVLVDQNGQFVTTSGSTATAGYLADLTGSVNVSAAAAPIVNQSLIATSGSAATWQFTPIAGGGTGGTTATAALANLGAAALAGAAFVGEVTVQAPVNPSDAVTKAYADAIASGLSVKPSVQEATTAALPANVYSNGSSGVGATLTGLATGTLTVDGILVALGDRVLVQDEAAPANNGIYSCTVAGALGVAYVLTRATDMDTPAQIPGAFCFCEQGTVNAGAGFVVASEGPFTIGTTAITWTQFSGTGEITPGTGLTKTGNTLSLTVPVTVADGGTGGTTATLAFGNLSPMTTPGDMLFQNSTPVAARLAGNTSATKMFLTQTGNGTVSANPAWGTIAAADVPTLNQNTTGTAATASAANALAASSGTVVSVSAAAGPASRQVLTATSGTTATWQNGALAVLTTPGDLLYESAGTTLTRLAIGAASTSLQSNGTLPSWQPAIALLATTGAGGYALVNGTGTVISWTAPNDGNLHRVLIAAGLAVTATQTGGNILVQLEGPGGSGGILSYNLFGSGNSGPAYDSAAHTNISILGAGQTVTISQSAAQTGGTATLYAEIWGS